MTNRDERDLTNLEYVTLGVISIEPQSGYSIVSLFEDDAYSWSASPGSVYPMLKRLEKSGMISSAVELEYETRPRKMYTLTEKGGQALDEWLRQVPQMRPFYQETEMALVRFRFMENRLSKAEIIQWLSNYLDAIRYADYVSKVYSQGILAAMEDGKTSLHAQLLMDMYFMQLNSLRTWLEMTRTRVEMVARQTGEYPIVE